MSSTYNVFTTCRLLTTIVILASVIGQSTANQHCPEKVANDPNPKFCATNSYGSLNVTRSEFENWNCIHPLDKYVETATVPCAPATAPTCGASTCDQTGPLVCARLPNANGRHGPFAYTTAVFANQCELSFYNCNNPTQTYKEVPFTGECTSIRF